MKKPSAWAMVAVLCCALLNGSGGRAQTISGVGLPTVGPNTAFGSVAGGTPGPLTQAQITAMINAATASLSGALPAWPNNTTTYFRGDGSYAPLNFGAVGGQATLAQLPAGTSDTALGYWGSTVASGNAIPNCSGALTYSTSTHLWGCNASAGTGNVVVSGSPSNGQIAQWTSPTNIQGINTVPAANGGAGTILGALKGNGAGAVSQAATSDLSDLVTPTSWTPSDQSGATLTFTSVTGLYTRIGKHVVAQFRLTYPTNSSGSTALIGGLPVASSASGATFAVGACVSNVASNFVLAASMAAGASSFGINNVAANFTNSNLTGATLTCTLSYISS